MSPSDRPASPAERGLQRERTTLAWERTGVAMMVAGVLLARYAAQDGYLLFALAGMTQTAAGGAVLVWAGVSAEDPVPGGDQQRPRASPAAVRVVGSVVVAFTTTALALAVVVAIAA